MNKRNLLFMLGGALFGAAGCFLALRFPGGRGRDRGGRFELSYREGRSYQVRYVVDGDTIIIEPGLYVRYAGVNTPEVKAVVDVQRPLGDEATAANRELVEGREVRLRFGGRKLDRYGRLLACVQVYDVKTGEWRDVGEELARRGLAKPMYGTDPSPNRESVARAADEAKSAGRGLWGLGKKKRPR